jgi:lysophospholipase L1-like esterase
VNLLVLGDSLSDGGWERDPAGVGSAWPASLERLAASGGIFLSVTNRARGGSRSVEVVSAFRESEAKPLEAVAVFAGANDLWRRFVPWKDHAPIDPEDFERNLKTLVRLATERGAERIWLLTPCLLHADPDHPWNADLSEYRAACARVSRGSGAVLVPTGEEFEAAVRARPDIQWTYDGVHPRPVGQERLAWTVYHHGMGGQPLPIGELPPRPKPHRLGRWP